MITMSVTDFARNMKEILNQVEYRGEELLLMRNKKPVVKLTPQNKGADALSVMADLYRVLPDAAAESWVADSRELGAGDGLKDPWAS
jgi:antitoxin (DNA-binding transcriptional repressor) of toxin-antitoxin stability system